MSKAPAALGNERSNEFSQTAWIGVPPSRRFRRSLWQIGKARPLSAYRLSLPILLAGTVLATVASAALAAEGGTIKSVVLSSGGLAAISRSIAVDGAASIHIDVPLDQVDDLLKSLVVRDPGGTVSAASLVGLSPLDETFRTMPFTPEAMGSLPDLAASLQGTTARASVDGRTVEGTILGVGSIEVPQETGKDPITERVLTLMTASGSVETVPLTTTASVEFLDPEVRAKLAKAAAAVGLSKVDRARQIEVKVDGSGKRDVSLTYVVPAPVWKTAYRVVLGDGGKARLQAWGILENATGEDWQDVDVTLTSGSPITLKQRLLESYWRDRPEIPVFAGAQAPPRPDTGAAARAKVASAGGARKAFMAQDMVAAAAPAPAGEAEADGGPPPPPVSEPTAVAAVSEDEAVSDFHLPGKLSVPAGHSLTVPFIDVEVPAERISVFQPELGGRNPVSAVLLKNTTSAALPPGILTLYAGAGYVGDAELLGLPAGEQRMASFAADRKTTIRSEVKPEETIVSITGAGGFLRATKINRLVTTYFIEASADDGRTVVIEHPRRAGWTPSGDAIDSETDTHVRLKAEVPKGERRAVKVTEEMPSGETVRLLDGDLTKITAWVSTSAIDPGFAAKIAKVLDARRAATHAEQAVKAAETQIKRISDDQARVRANLEAVPAGSELQKSYLTTLADQEKRISAAIAARDKATDDSARAKQALEDAIAAI